MPSGEENEDPLGHVGGEVRVDARLPPRHAVNHCDVPSHERAKRFLGPLGHVGAKKLGVVHGHWSTLSSRGAANRTRNLREAIS